MPCTNPLTVRSNSPGTDDQGHPIYSYAVPCGKCYMCRKRKTDEWSFRLRYEQAESKTCLFVTLTYSESLLPRSETLGIPTLDRKAVPAFIKRLRSLHKYHLPDSPPIKYYAVGEYGSERFRPHYHLILFNAFQDWIPHAWSTKFKGEKVSIGRVEAEPVKGRAAAYCQKYLDKGRTVPECEIDDRVPEFSLMSKGLGIGYANREDYKKWHKDGLKNYIVDEGKKIALPRYYRQKIFSDSEKDTLALIAQATGEAVDLENYENFLRTYPNSDYSEYLRVSMERIAHNDKKLKKDGKTRNKDF